MHTYMYMYACISVADDRSEAVPNGRCKQSKERQQAQTWSVSVWDVPVTSHFSFQHMLHYFTLFFSSFFLLYCCFYSLGSCTTLLHMYSKI